MLVSFSCIKLALLRCSRLRCSNVHTRFVTFGTRKPRPWGKDEPIVWKFNKGFTDFASFSDKSQHSQVQAKFGSRRQQFNFIADAVESPSRSVVVVCIYTTIIKDPNNNNCDGIAGAGALVETNSQGSGFIIRSYGLIITNAHVVDEHGRIFIDVCLHDGRVVAGELCAVDVKSDLALIRIMEKNLPVLSLGCSSETRIGEWVAAIGCPFYLSKSVTAGVVSNVNRQLQDKNNNIFYIQHDASTNAGNSGGPLVNLDGDAIGVQTCGFKWDEEKVAGISFAIPSDYVKTFLAEVETRIKAGTAVPFHIHRYVGLSLIDLTEDIVADLEQRGVKGVRQGAFVVKVGDGPPAFLDGILPGDVIVKINDKIIYSAKEVYDVLEALEAEVVPFWEVERATAKPGVKMSIN